MFFCNFVPFSFRCTSCHYKSSLLYHANYRMQNYILLCGGCMFSRGKTGRVNLQAECQKSRSYKFTDEYLPHFQGGLCPAPRIWQQSKQWEKVSRSGKGQAITHMFITKYFKLEHHTSSDCLGYGPRLYWTKPGNGRVEGGSCMPADQILILNVTRVSTHTVISVGHWAWVRHDPHSNKAAMISVFLMTKCFLYVN